MWVVCWWRDDSPLIQQVWGCGQPVGGGMAVPEASGPDGLAAVDWGVSPLDAAGLPVHTPSAYLPLPNMGWSMPVAVT